MDPNDSLVGNTLGRWQLVRLIGKGGMGRVYEAQEAGAARFGRKRKVAIKVLNDELTSDPAFVKRFRREARLLAELSHPHVVSVLEQGEDKGRVWFAMAFVRGENLRRRIERGPVEPREAARIASEVASALAYAHDRQIIHRDLKPENVLLDADGHVHLVDFGLSRLVAMDPADASTRLTRTDVIMGTYEYMSPEQRRGDRALDARADIFGLGVILYEMLTGGLPLGRFALPSETSSRIPEGFDGVVNRALATNRRDRFASAADFQAAVTKALDTRPRKDAPRTPEAPQPITAVADARKVLRHVDILAAIDKVGGAILLAGGLGWLSLSNVLGFGGSGSLVQIGGVVAMIFGIYLIDLGGKLSKLKQGARESQVTASALMLLFPPVLTVAGIYGLIIMTSDRARAAFALGRTVLRPDSTETVVTVKRARPVETVIKHPRRAGLLMRLFHFVAVVWSLYAAFVAIELFMFDGGDFVGTRGGNIILSLRHAEVVRDISIVAAGLALVVLMQSFINRKSRRGLGLAVIAFLFLMAAAARVIGGVEDAIGIVPPDLRDLIGSISTTDALPRALVAAQPQHLPPLLEIPA